jgi:hypothetical protein
MWSMPVVLNNYGATILVYTNIFCKQTSAPYRPARYQVLDSEGMKTVESSEFAEQVVISRTVLSH